jgi:hypothetical protein
VDLALASVPGITFGGPPGSASPCGGTWPTTVRRGQVMARVSIGERMIEVAAPALGEDGAAFASNDSGAISQAAATAPPIDPRSRLGDLCGARSGDKGGDANVGVWARDPAHFAWLAAYLTPERLRGWLPEPFDGAIDRYLLPNVAALNFVLRGYLGEGAAASVRLDNQAKLVGEIIRVRILTS